MLFALSMLSASVGANVGISGSYNPKRDEFLDNATKRIKQTLTLPQSEQVGQLGKHIQTVTYTHDKGNYDISYTIDIVANSPKALTKKAKLYSYQIAHYIGVHYNKEHLQSKGFVVKHKTDND